MSESFFRGHQGHISHYLSKQGSDHLTLRVAIHNTGIKALFKPALQKYTNYEEIDEFISFRIMSDDSVPLGGGSSLIANANVSSSSGNLTPREMDNKKSNCATWSNGHLNKKGMIQVCKFVPPPAYHPRHRLPHKVDPVKVVLVQLNLVLIIWNIIKEISRFQKYGT